MRTQMSRWSFGLFVPLALIALIAQACHCGDEAITSRGKPLGDLCETDFECESGLCDAIPGGQMVCMKPCSHGCDYDDGEICTTLATTETGPRQACVPDKGGLCNECSIDADCPYPGDVCLQIDGRGVCGRDCSFEGSSCPDGYICAEALNSAGLVVNRQCQPKTGSCDCLPETAGQKRSCTITNAMGTCGGMETCDPEQGWVGCDARVPKAEECNLVDDNCDGRIDEDSETAQNPAAGIQPKTCGAGACFRSVPGCIDGEVQTCEPGEPTAEICNGLDDDCDGEVDEDFVAMGLGTPCSNGIGLCQQAGVMVCNAEGDGIACGAVPLPPGVEVCNQLDDDCNGIVDDMGTVKCGVGICENEILRCQNGIEPECVPNNHLARTEICNELDDDCDGFIDEDFDLSTDSDNCGKCGNACRAANGSAACDQGECIITSCNVDQGYDDCDQRYSNGCEQDIWGSLDHCGGCNQVCSFPNASARCTGGACSMGPCLPGWYDSNGDPADGCEYACTFVSINDEPDDGFVDANCDGIDGELENAIFVDCSAGSDTNPGTKERPLKTITRALQNAPNAGKRQILVASGLCNESVTLVNGIGLYGGYNGQTWSRNLNNLPIIQPSVGGVPALKGDGILSPTAVDGFVIAAQAGLAPSGSSIAVQLNNSNGVRISNSDIRAAAGAPGVDGKAGTKGADGSEGGDGDPAGDGTDAGGYGGSGGYSPCGSGRSGGRGGYKTNKGSDGTDVPGVPCSTNTGGDYGNCSAGSSCERRLGGEPGGVGCHGANGDNGANGTGGDGAGVISNGNFGPANGGDGKNGENGVPGAGGGGGGGSLNRNCASVFGACGCVTTGCYSDRGAGGGGGGGAGCGGTRGTGGTGGGGSIGILLVNSSPQIRNTKISTANGGKGGNGMPGGAPGNGGAYGAGGAKRDDGGPGGRGGRGGNGGRGGAGGGGGGGPSVGVYRANGSNPTLTGVTYTLGQGGAGGAGGTTTNRGQNGVRANVYP